jgi:tetratricopeptide (TPR) repeat protein
MVCVALFLGSPQLFAKAPKKPVATVAAEHMAAANQAFQAGRYDQALDELRQAYRLAPRPEFLLTFAQIYRAAGRLQPALEACNSYLATAPNGALASDAQKLADVLRAEIERANPPPTPAPPAPVEPPAAVHLEPPPVAAPQVVIPSSDTDEAGLRAQRRRRRTVLGVALGVTGVVVVGLAVGLGVGLTVGAGRKSTFGSIDFTP